MSDLNVLNGEDRRAPLAGLPEVGPSGPANRIKLEDLRVPQNFDEMLDIEKLLTNVPVRKPDKNWFIQVHPEEVYRLRTGVVEYDRETYLVDRPLWGYFQGDAAFGLRDLVLAVNRQGVHFIWPLKLPPASGRFDPWNSSAMAAADKARTHWVRVKANMDLGAYDVAVAKGDLPDPEWPKHSFEDILNVAFRGRFIDSVDHPVAKSLRGEA